MFNIFARETWDQQMLHCRKYLINWNIDWAEQSVTSLTSPTTKLTIIVRENIKYLLIMLLTCITNKINEIQRNHNNVIKYIFASSFFLPLLSTQTMRWQNWCRTFSSGCMVMERPSWPSKNGTHLLWKNTIGEFCFYLEKESKGCKIPDQGWQILDQPQEGKFVFNIFAREIRDQQMLHFCEYIINWNMDKYIDWASQSSRSWPH